MDRRSNRFEKSAFVPVEQRYLGGTQLIVKRKILRRQLSVGARAALKASVSYCLEHSAKSVVADLRFAKTSVKEFRVC